MPQRDIHVLYYYVVPNGLLFKNKNIFFVYIIYLTSLVFSKLTSHELPKFFTTVLS